LKGFYSFLAGKLMKIGVISGENLKKSKFLGKILKGFYIFGGKIFKTLKRFWRENLKKIKIWREILKENYSVVLGNYQ
jgi:hypothetical protein